MSFQGHGTSKVVVHVIMKYIIKLKRQMWTKKYSQNAPQSGCIKTVNLAEKDTRGALWLTSRPLFRALALAAVGSNLLRTQKVGSHMPSIPDEAFSHRPRYRKVLRLTRWLSW